MTLFEKIGGQPTIEKVVDNFHQLILADSSISGFFAKTDMNKQRGHQVAFFSQLLDGPKAYAGRPMDKTHTGMSLQQSHFDAIAKHLTDAMTGAGVSAEDAKAAIERVSKLKGAILNK
ncbi:group I truncated hemoglobin [Calothrix rhizosoleniae]|uniref:group I truncated hemoglobin n=1 Tax=Calothrix rhizosoleniae TaxID=888997 RepID=UPI000B4A07DF|nr:group 1 truncated hemoglobin [Calothrix rhizosoleniae]